LTLLSDRLYPRALRRLGCACLLALAAFGASAAPIPWGDREVQLDVREQPIALFAQELFGRLDLQVSVSPAAKGAVNGSFSGPAERVWRNIARSFGLIEYYDGAVVYIVTPSEMATRTLPATGAVAARVLRSARETSMLDARNTLRNTQGGTLIAAGTKRFIEQVEDLMRGQAAANAAQPPLGFKVFYLRYAWAHDVVLNFGGRQLTVPGVATVVRAMMTANPRSQVSVLANEQSFRPTVPKLRGQGLTGLGTLGTPDANARGSSADALIAAYGGTAAPGGGVQPAAQPGAIGGAVGGTIGLGDAQQVRVEADSRLNAVIVRDAPERIAQYEQLIGALDVEPQTLEIEATIIDVDTNKARELGINWRYTRGRGSLLFGDGTDADLSLRGSTPAGDITLAGNGGFASAVLGGLNELALRVKALEEQGVARIVSSPQVLTLSNVEAVLDTSRTFYVRVAGEHEVDLFSVSAGTTLRVTPHVFTDRGEVRIKLLVSIDDGSISQDRVDAIPVVDRASINTQALIYEGESLLIGGLTRESTSNGVTKVPWLGDLPLIGNLFKRNADSNRRTERMFLIAPRLAPAHRQASAAPKPAAPAGVVAPTGSGAEPAPRAAPREP
jgi:type III secretion protein C